MTDPSRSQSSDRSDRDPTEGSSRWLRTVAIVLAVVVLLIVVMLLVGGGGHVIPEH